MPMTITLKDGRSFDVDELMYQDNYDGGEWYQVDRQYEVTVVETLYVRANSEKQARERIEDNDIDDWSAAEEIKWDNFVVRWDSFKKRDA